jgi:hypothetical protein
MPRVRRNEWNFAANAAQAITSILARDEYDRSPLGRAEPELTEYRGARRLDLVLFARRERDNPLVTGELKVPWDPEGRTPHNARVLEDAHRKAANAGALYFITWNIRRVVVWKTDDPGVALPERVIYDDEIIPVSIPLRSAADLEQSEIRDKLASGIERLTAFLSSTLTGPAAPVFLPLDRLFIARLEAALDFPILSTLQALVTKSEERRFKLPLERWMRDEMGWVVSEATQDENISRASRFTCYVLVNRLCFYNALRRKYPRLPRLAVANNINTGAALERRLDAAFADAKRFTGDYETVFDGDFGDTLPFLANDAVPDWRTLIRTLDQYDFANIGVDVIGGMYEQLITPEERHRYGQHYTQPAVVDLISSLAISTGNERVLDPACGGGTFLVRAYARKAILDPNQEHTQLLAELYGCDVLKYASLLENGLLDAGLAEATEYIRRHPVAPDVWPVELRDEVRREIDMVVLRAIGVPENAIDEVRTRLCNELVNHIRKLRLLELEAQINRRGANAGTGPTPRELASDMWGRFIASGELHPRRVPDDFLREIETRRFNIPSAGVLRIEHPSLFEPNQRIRGRLGVRTLDFRNESEAEYISILSGNGIFGDVQVPTSAEGCRDVARELSSYIASVTAHFSQSAAEVTSNTHLQQRIVKEGLRRVTNGGARG